VLAKAYNISSGTVHNANCTLSLFESGNYFNPTDLESFLSLYSLKAPSISTVGRNSPETCVSYAQYCYEATLDVEFATGIAQAPTTFWEASSSRSVFEDWIVAVANMADAPLVHSISYGELESQSTSSIMQRFDAEAAKLGLRGISVVVASGDDGVAGVVARNNKRYCGFNAGFPASSPHVTAVGGTQGVESGQKETGCSAKTGGVITSGGGFSDEFGTSDYQLDAVQRFLNRSTSLPPHSLFNSSGRAYPDVALAALHYAEHINNGVHVASGTSAAAPVFAAVLALVNDARISRGMPSVGFVNPALYQLQNSGVFHDITSGNNACCADVPDDDNALVCCDHGFTAAVGFDPMAGLGSVDVGRLIEAMVAM